jgi:hypothetical protein
MQQTTYSMNGLTLSECQQLTQHLNNLRKKPKHERGWKKWSVQEEIELLNLVSQGLTREELSKKLGRTPNGILSRLCLIGQRKEMEQMSQEEISTLTGTSKQERDQNIKHWKERDEKRKNKKDEEKPCCVLTEKEQEKLDSALTEKFKTFIPKISRRKVYVSQISRKAHARDLRDLFEKYGRIMSIEVNNLNGYGFVEFEDARDAADAIRDLDGQELMGKRLHVDLGLHVDLATVAHLGQVDM